MNWFEIKVKYQKIDEQGKESNVSETYLVDALSFTEAEARIIKEMEPYLGEEFQIVNMKRANYSELYEDETGDRYYKCKTVFVTLDEEKGKERRTANYILVQANDMQHSLSNLQEYLKDTTVDWDLTAITETPIMDVYKYFDQDADDEIPDNLKPIDEVKDEE